MKETAKNEIEKDRPEENELVFSPQKKKEEKIIVDDTTYKITFPRMKSMQFRIWFSFILMTVIVLIIMWAFEIVYYSTVFKSNESSEVSGFGSHIIEQYKEYAGGALAKANFKSAMDNYASENNINIFIQNMTTGDIVSSSVNSGLSASALDSKVKTMVENTIKKDGEYYIIDTASTDEVKAGMIIFCCREYISGSSILFYISSEVPILDATRNAFIYQLMIITVVCLVLTVVVAFLGSTIVSKPLHDLAVNVKKAAVTKDHKIKQTNTGLVEIDELSMSFNDAMQKVEDNSNFRKDLLANVSHDMKTPLTMIRAYAEMIRDISGGNKEKSAKNAGIIINEADRLNALISEVIEVSKLETGVYELHNAYFSLSAMINESIHHFSIMEMTKGYYFSMNVEENIFVRADSERIERVLYNLIGNAINYTGEDKKVIIRCRKKKGIARVEVIDTGKGMTKEEMGEVWGKYYRLLQDKRKVLGSGLGLSIVKNILELHGITYGVKSTKGKGSDFWFELPCYTEKEMTKLAK